MTFNYKWESSPGKNHIHSDLTGEDQQMDESASKSAYSIFTQSGGLIYWAHTFAEPRPTEPNKTTAPTGLYGIH